MSSSGIDELRCAVLDRCRPSVELGYPRFGSVLVLFRVDATQQCAGDPEALSYRKVQSLGEYRLGSATCRV